MKGGEVYNPIDEIDYRCFVVINPFNPLSLVLLPHLVLFAIVRSFIIKYFLFMEKNTFRNIWLEN